MIKYMINKLNFILIPIIFCSELIAIEILEVKLMDSYKITRELPGKLLPAQQSNLAFEIPGKINVINVDIGDVVKKGQILAELDNSCLLYTSPSPRDGLLSRMPSSA